MLSAFLEKLFTKYVDYGFTADLEDQLDNITSGKEDWIKVLEKFWNDFNVNVSNVKEKRTREVLDLLNESLGELIFESNDGEIDRKCKLCTNGELSLKIVFGVVHLLVALIIQNASLLDLYLKQRPRIKLLYLNQN